ncbi:valine--tRNA ligase [Mycoplasma sp. 332]|uniref:valine--tRNA ligase n=1 Tax=Mycoplasma sp. 332 TaxID=3458236 RepID=UPI004035EE41
MNKKKITGFRVQELKKINKIKKNNYYSFEYLINDLNFKLSKSSILGIIADNIQSKKNIFNLLIDRDNKIKDFQGFIEFKQDDENFYMIDSNQNFRDNLAYGFESDDLFETKSEETVFAYLKNYIKENKVTSSFNNIFKNSWKDVYQDSRYHFRLEYSKTNYQLQYSLEPLVNELKLILSKNNAQNLNKLNQNDQILLMQNLSGIIHNIAKNIQNHEQSFFTYIEQTIKNYVSGKSLMQYNEYKEAKTNYLEICSKKDINSNHGFKSKLLTKIKKIIDKLKEKKQVKKENNKYFSRLRKSFSSEILLNKFHLKTNLKIDSFNHYYGRYYINKIIQRFLTKHFFLISLLNRTSPLSFIDDLYDLRKNIINEISLLGTYWTRTQLKKQIKLIANSMITNNFSSFIERFKSLKNKKNHSPSLLLVDKEDNNEKTSDYIDISTIKEYEYKFEEKQAEFHWNVENIGKSIRDETKNYNSKLANVFQNNIENAKKIFKNIKELLNNLHSLNKIEFEEDFNQELTFLNPFLRAFFNLKELNFLLNNLFNQFLIYKRIFETSDAEEAMKRIIFKSNIYRILLNANLSLDKLTMKLSYLSKDEKIALELSKILINNPSLIVIGNNIDKIDAKNQIEVLNKINEYILENEAIGIYLLSDIKTASKLTTDLQIMINSRIIERGKTNIVVDNPINPVVKKMLDKKDDYLLSNYEEFIDNIDEIENIFEYEIEPDHYISCKWNQLSKWINKDNTQNKKIRNIFSFDRSLNKNEKAIKDKRNYDEEKIIDFSIQNIATNLGDNMDKNFNHKLVEQGRHQKWIDMKTFSTHDIKKPPFTIILPPPNVTGKLHIGHALDTYIQDTIIRYKKIKGFDVMWVAGKDHAGIATQAVVEKRLSESGRNKYQLGREKFIKEIWKWKDEYSQNINDQWAKLGLALDYNSERFTLDKDASEAVAKVFIDMYNKGLIYRDTKAILWDPKLKTALSNIEVIPTETNQKMYYIKYPFKNDKNNYLLVATTRVETMFSDVAIALNPNDERFNSLKNKTVIHPLTKKEIPIISSENIDPNFGTGAMKVSAHAIDDIEIIKNYGLSINECINDDGLMNSLAKEFQGLDRFEARIKIAQYLETKGFIYKTENIISNIGYSERTKEPIEILVKPQWFVKMNSLSEQLLKNLDSMEGVKIIPKRFKDNLVKWMENVHDWTISRQIWWGHRIPVWYKGNEIKVQTEKPGNEWIQDSDVLDTWFSSALAPFVFLGWPQSSEKLKRYFPTSLLVTGYDIIFFWVSRMYFQSLEFMDKIPFKEVLLHGLVRDSHGRKMSKSLGNGIDPIKVIGEYGSDVLRMSLIFNCTPGLDINFGDEKIQSARLFINKIWNIGRLIKNIPINIRSELQYEKLDNFDKWILLEFLKMTSKIDEAMKNYEFTLVYKHIQEFMINKFSSWYLEFLKFKKNDYFIHYLFREILIMLQPYMPFVTDYLFQEIYNEELWDNALANYTIEDTFNSNEINNLIELITTFRKYREEKQISKNITLNYFIENFDISENQQLIIFKLSNFVIGENNDLSIQTSFAKVFIKQSKEDKENEIIELKKLIEKTKKEIEFNKTFINNPNFMKNASEDKIKEKQEKLALHQRNLEVYEEELTKKDNS